MSLRFSSITSNFYDLWRWHKAAFDYSSWFRICIDLLRLKIQRVSSGKIHSIRLKNNLHISYRLNKGDLWSMREVLLDECYRLPSQISPKVIVDLGGNIGLTSLWFITNYHPDQLVCVEPVASNADLIRQNLKTIDSEFTLIEAAIGSFDGSAYFNESEESNLGTLIHGQNGETRVLSMPTLIAATGIKGDIDLLKVDIEGGEADLFSGDLTWLKQVRAIIAEFHPDVVDVVAITFRICAQGFEHIPANSVFPGNMDFFIRKHIHG